ncbi:MAG: hypothetical protein K2J84_09930 [Bacteroidaceae bacterium]|nr:hypothetical protein [Bacteroidaceae bacterium]
MKRLLFLVTSIVAMMTLHAQSDGGQVLVFRYSGEVNLLHASRLDSITLSVYDADSVMHGEAVTQVFHARDTTLVVPLAEIDSVAFGSRNIAEMRPGVKEMTAATDLPWILRFDGASIHYRPDTPSSVLPKVGERLFFGLDGGESDESVFPCGLTAKATAVTPLADGIRVDVERVELAEIFSRLFYAGYIRQERQVSIKRRKAHGEANLELELPADDLGSVTLKGNVTVEGPVTLNPLAKRVALDLDIDISVGMDVKLEADESLEKHYESFDGHYAPVGTFFKVLNIGLAAGAFADLAASLDLDLGLERTYRHKVKYERKGDDVKWEHPQLPEEERVADNVHIDLTLEGSVFFGPVVALQVSTVGELFGARAKLKGGPRYSGKVGMSFIAEAQQYDADAYDSATLEVSNRAALEGYVFNRNLAWGEVTEHKIADLVLDANRHTLHLFPEFKETTGVEAPSATATEITVSTKVDNDIPNGLEIGFELVGQDDAVVDSVFLNERIQSGTTAVQGFEAGFTLPKRTTPGAHPLTVRPVFHYAGHTIPHKAARLLHDSHIMPITAYGTNGVAAYISGASAVGFRKTDSVTSHLGNYLPIPQLDPVFFPTGSYEPDTPGKPLNDEDVEKLLGTWTGEMGGDAVSITFHDDDEQSGIYMTGRDSQVCVYRVNSPQSGDVCLLLDDRRTVLLTVVSVSDTALVLRKKGEREPHTLHRQY